MWLYLRRSQLYKMDSKSPNKLWLPQLSFRSSLLRVVAFRGYVSDLHDSLFLYNESSQANEISHQVSGGGGWGLKQGLLSLDPQTRYAAPGDDDIESFIRSFKGETAADNVITPGSYIQFLVEPATSPSEPASTTKTSSSTGLKLPTVSIGTCPANEDQEQAMDGDVQVLMDYFGALSSQGVFVASSPEVSTKIDVPNTRIAVNME
jgi:hypothetical protein